MAGRYSRAVQRAAKDMRKCMRSRTRRNFLLFSILILMFSLTGVHAGLVGSSGGIRVVSEDGHGVLLAFRMPAFSLDEQHPDGLRIEVPGWVRTTRPGAADFPIAGALIEVPAGSTCRAAQMLSAREVPFSTDRIARVAGLGTEVYPLSAGDAEADSKPSIRIEKPVVIRGASFVRLLIHPFGWDEGRHTVTYWETALIRVDFTPNGAAVSAAPTVRIPRNQLPSGLTEAGSAYPPGARVRIEVNEDGIYEVSSGELERLGFRVSDVSPRNLQLWNAGRQVAFSLANVRTARRRLMFALRFYATAVDTPFTGTNVYWLCRGPGEGERMTSRNVSPNLAAPLQTWFDETAVRNERHLMWESTPLAPVVNYWFWERLTAPVTRSHSVRLSNPVERTDPARLKIWFRGRSTDLKSPSHHIAIRWDTSLLGDAKWDDTDEYCAELPLTKEQLTAGDHTVTLNLPGDTGATVDVLYLDRFEVRYGRRLDAGSTGFPFRVESLTSKTLELRSSVSSGFGLYEVTDPANVVRLEGAIIQSGPDGTVVQFHHPEGAAASYYFAIESQLKKPATMAYWDPQGLRNTENQADHLIIAPAEFKSALDELRSYRESQGLHSRIVTTEEIFNEFSDGFPEPEGIRRFLDHAYYNWSKPAPRYVLLVGDANIDYRDYLKTGKKSKVPAHVSWTSVLGLAPEDHWYACLDGDDPLPDLMLGRLPGATAAQVAQIIAKILQFERSGGKANPKALAAADNGESIFEETSEKLVGLLPPYFAAQKIYLRQMTAASAKTALLEGLSSGPAIATYVGHGATRNWAGESILESADVAKIANPPERLSFVLALNCLNAYFAQPSYYSLSEELVAAPGKAAVACFAPSALSFPTEHQVIGVELFSAIFKDHQLTVGNAVVQAKINGYAQGVIDETLVMFTLLGDPATRLKGW